MPNFNNEVTIIGGGPAGSIAAINLSDLGFDVCLIEKKSFPRETLCGEFLSKEVVLNLKQLGLYDEFISLNPNPINRFRLINNDGKEISTKLIFTAFGLRRSVFDNFLLGAAKRKGIKVMQPEEVKMIKREDDAFILYVKDINANKVSIKSKYVIAAYGKHNILDKSLNRSFANIKSSLNGVKYHFDSMLLNEFNKEEISIYLANSIYCGVNAVDAGKVTICFLEKRNNKEITSRENLLKFISETEKFNKIFKPGYEELIMSNPVWGTGDIFFGKRKAVENGIFMIGDAAGVIAPITGDGIGMAFQSAGIISQVLLDIRCGNRSIQDAEEIYQIKWNSLFKSRLQSSHIIQSVIMKNFGRMLGVNLLNKFPQILPYFINITRG
jgi:flavin-dependent dehydrogenase